MLCNVTGLELVKEEKNSEYENELKIVLREKDKNNWKLVFHKSDAKLFLCLKFILCLKVDKVGPKQDLFGHLDTWA